MTRPRGSMTLGDLAVWVILPLCDPTIGGNQLDQMTGHIITMLPRRASPV